MKTLYLHLGGTGGGVKITAGDGAGQQEYGSYSGDGGDVTVTAGGSVEGYGGHVSVQFII